MAEYSSSQLSTAQISKVTDIISANNRQRFSAEYLRINPNQYKTIEYDEKFKHHDILFKCINVWKNKIEGEGLDGRQKLIELLTKVQQEKGWFSKQDLAFLFDGETVKITPIRE